MIHLPNHNLNKREEEKIQTIEQVGSSEQLVFIPMETIVAHLRLLAEIRRVIARECQYSLKNSQLRAIELGIREDYLRIEKDLKRLNLAKKEVKDESISNTEPPK